MYIYVYHIAGPQGMTLEWMNARPCSSSVIHQYSHRYQRYWRIRFSPSLIWKLKDSFPTDTTFLHWMEESTRSPLFALITKIYEVHHLWSCQLPGFHYFGASHHSVHPPCYTGTRAPFWKALASGISLLRILSSVFSFLQLLAILSSSFLHQASSSFLHSLSSFFHLLFLPRLSESWCLSPPIHWQFSF